jgi:hypothetical protein
VPNRADAPLPALGERVEVGWPRKAGLVFAEPATAEQQERGT